MGIVPGVVLGIIGVILITGAVKLPDSIENNINHNTLGWILLIAGVILVVLGLMATQRRRTTVVERDHTVDHTIDPR